MGLSEHVIANSKTFEMSNLMSITATSTTIITAKTTITTAVVTTMPTTTTQ